MYQAAYYDRTTYTYHVRDDEKGWVDFKYTPELYKIVPNGSLKTLNGKLAEPTTKYEWKDTSLYEQDVDKLTRVLIDVYKESDDAPKFHNVIYKHQLKHELVYLHLAHIERYPSTHILW
jgi:hypothetical protein